MAYIRAPAPILAAAHDLLPPYDPSELLPCTRSTALSDTLPNFIIDLSSRRHRRYAPGLDSSSAAAQSRCSSAPVSLLAEPDLIAAPLN